MLMISPFILFAGYFRVLQYQEEKRRRKKNDEYITKENTERERERINLYV